MKLRTRIIGICCAAVFLASLLCDLLIWRMNAASLRNEAELKACQNYYQIYTEFMQNWDENKSRQSDTVLTEADRIYLDYFFKQQKDDYVVCVWNPDVEEAAEGTEGKTDKQEEIYNHTALSASELKSLKYKIYSEDTHFKYASLTWEDRDYLVFSEDGTERMELYYITDITYVKEESRQFAAYILLITFAVTGAALLVLCLILRKVFDPLKKLNETTGKMAQGQYGQRVEIHRMDEVGQLGESFNRMAEAVEIRTRSLEESERRKTLFMGNLTHELKTPMTAISGYAQTMLNVKLSPEEETEALQYIYGECGRLERLSRKMTELLELDSEQALVFENVSVKQLFEAAEKACGVILKKKQMTLKCVEHGETFYIDSDLMTDVLINLIDNGVKASEPGGEIILRAEEGRIEVEDFGRGIPKEEQEKILEPFYMVDKSRSRRSGGAGLGLALTAVIVKKHHIRLEVDSTEGRGTRMILHMTEQSGDVS